MRMISAGTLRGCSTSNITRPYTALDLRASTQPTCNGRKTSDGSVKRPPHWRMRERGTSVHAAAHWGQRGLLWPHRRMPRSSMASTTTGGFLAVHNDGAVCAAAKIV